MGYRCGVQQFLLPLFGHFPEILSRFQRETEAVQETANIFARLKDLEPSDGPIAISICFRPHEACSYVILKKVRIRRAKKRRKTASIFALWNRSEENERRNGLISSEVCGISVSLRPNFHVLICFLVTKMLAGNRPIISRRRVSKIPRSIKLGCRSLSAQQSAEF